MYEVKQLEEVVLFSIGLMSDPTPLADHVYQVRHNRLLKLLREGKLDEENEEKLTKLGKNIDDFSFFESLYKESAVRLPGSALHNQHINIYHGNVTSPPFLPSKSLEIQGISADIQCTVAPLEVREEDLPDTIIIASFTEDTSTRSLLKLIGEVSQLQPISDLCLNNCKDPANEVRIRMSNQAESIHLWNCDLSELTLRNFFQQLSNSSTLSRINLGVTGLHHIESLPLQQLPSLTHLRLWNANLGLSHILHLRYLLQNRKLPKLMHMNLGGNDLYHVQRNLGKVLLETATNHPGTIVVWLKRSNLPKEFIKYYRECTKHSNTLYIVGGDHDSHCHSWEMVSGVPPFSLSFLGAQMLPPPSPEASVLNIGNPGLNQFESDLLRRDRNKLVDILMKPIPHDPGLGFSFGPCQGDSGDEGVKLGQSE